MILEGAIWRPVPYGIHVGKSPREFLFRRKVDFCAVVVHTNGGGDLPIQDDLSLYGWWLSKAKQGLRLGAHVQVMTSGKFEQYVDTDLVVAHAYDASFFAVGVEVEDDGNPRHLMNDNQLETIVDICRQLKVPPRQLSCYPNHGVGWHQKCPRWNQSIHNCPGPVRVGQVIRDIIPALKEDDDMGFQDDPNYRRLQGVVRFRLGQPLDPKWHDDIRWGWSSEKKQADAISAAAKSPAPGAHFHPEKADAVHPHRVVGETTV